MSEAAAKEPSMEDILSSIRKIIAEEAPVTANRNDVVAGAQHDQAVVAKEDDVIVEKSYHRSGEAEQVQAAAQLDDEPTSDTGIDSGSSEMTLAEIAASLRAYRPTASSSDETTFQSVASEKISEVDVGENDQNMPTMDHIQMSKATLPHTDMEKQPLSEEIESSADRPASSDLMSPSSAVAVSGSFDRLKRNAMDNLDAKTELILRPMLREWLDDNLPSLVERLVREEIERVARG